MEANLTWKDIAESYLRFVMSMGSQHLQIIVVFDGYGSSTKDHDHLRRTKNACSLNEAIESSVEVRAEDTDVMTIFRGKQSEDLEDLRFDIFSKRAAAGSIKPDGLIPPDALRQRYGSGTSWPRSPQQIGSTLINETISTGRGCGASQQRPRSGSPRRSAIIP
ncbi:unnamed protein product [Boreogadus saida]